MKTLADEPQPLRRFGRDLSVFIALPAFRPECKPQVVVENLADILMRTLDLEFVYIRVKGSPAEAVLEVVRAGQQSDLAGQAHAIGQALTLWLQAANSGRPSTMPHPMGRGTVRLAVIPIGVEGDDGVVAAGSRQEDFPTALDRLLLNVGANQIASWLREVRLLAALREADRQKDHALACERAAQSALQRSASELAVWKNRYEEAIQATGQLL